MIKVIEIRKVIKGILKSQHSQVYYEHASDKAVYPYLVFDLPDSIDDGSMEQFVLDVDGWDSPINGDTTTLETLMDIVDKSLHRKTVVINNELSMTFYRENRLPLKDDDKRIRRRKYIYQVRTHAKGGI
ncbi:hypothetical protein [Fredinandcohnia sp. 179-A 10B2 NHS]|uniref:hypothetical protein n=1 Tax=Fredinandcohnia sp. 179-A 10B2 NHS TaxID=3235176 RepID=UPI0039A23441